MIPLAIADAIIWGVILIVRRNDKKHAAMLELFDPDMYNLWNSSPVRVPENYEDIILKQEFEKQSSFQNLDKYESWEQLHSWYQIYSPSEIIHANGEIFLRRDPEDTIRFKDMCYRAQVDQVYNDIPFEDGGKNIMYIDQYLMMGISKERAQELIKIGVKPRVYEEKFDWETNI